MDFLYSTPERLVTINYVAGKAAMDMIRREAATEDKGDDGTGIGLGWLLAIALCGGVLFFAAVGYLLVWWLKTRSQPLTTRVYAHDHTSTMDYEMENGVGPSAGGGELFGVPPSESSVTVLAKKRFLRSESSISKLSGHLTSSSTVLWKPPVLPPLPTHNSFTFGGGKRRSGGRVDDGDPAEHGPKFTRRSWRDSWMAMMMTRTDSKPTLPNLDMDDEVHEEDLERGRSREARRPFEEVTRQPSELQIPKKRRSNLPLMTSQTAPELSVEDDTDEPPRGRSRVAGYAQHQSSSSRQEQQSRPGHATRIRPSVTETELKDILISTEQRLRDGTSRSPVKTPHASPTKGSSSRGTPSKGSPTKTPRSCRTGSSTKTAGRMTPSPSKKNLQNGTPTKTKTSSQHGSVSSIGSAANSLIRAATEELELPDGSSSPSRLRGKEWGVANREEHDLKQQERQAQIQRPRSQSLDSQSSALSTLYSVGEPDEEEDDKWPVVIPTRRKADPFVESRIPRFQQANQNTYGSESRPGLTGPRPLRRTKTISAGSLVGEAIDETAVPAPLRTISVNSHMGRAGRQGDKKSGTGRTIILSPPKGRFSEEVKPKTAANESKKANLASVPSSMSIATESSYTDVTVNDETFEEDTTPKAEELPKHKRANSSLSTSTTPTKRNGNGRSLDLSSSPLNEREVISMLMESTQSRNLPLPPPSAITLNGEPMPTPLSPRPKSRNQNQAQSRRASLESISSLNSYDRSLSEYETLGEMMPPRRATLSGLSAFTANAAHSVGSTVAELRRMNSFMSSYSVASVASTILGGDGVSESPTLPTLRGGGFSPARTNSKNEASGRRNYLNFGTPPPNKETRKKKKGTESAPTSPMRGKGHKKSASTSSQPRSSIPVRADKKEDVEDKENTLPSQRTVRFEVPTGLREGRTGINLAPPSSIPTLSSTMTPEQRRLQRESADSLGLYDKDGFLKNSPDRDAVAKGGRLRM